MRALNLHAVGDLRYEEVPDPVRQEGEVLLKVKACGICGSDIPRIFKKGTYHFPTIPGQEFSGEIVEADRPELVGKKVRVKITEVMRSRRRVVGSIRAVTQRERRERAEKIWNEIEVGKRYHGVVKSLTIMRFSSGR